MDSGEFGERLGGNGVYLVSLVGSAYLVNGGVRWAENDRFIACRGASHRGCAE